MLCLRLPGGELTPDEDPWVAGNSPSRPAHHRQPVAMWPRNGMGILPMCARLPALTTKPRFTGWQARAPGRIPTGSIIVRVVWTGGRVQTGECGQGSDCGQGAEAILTWGRGVGRLK